MEKKSSRPIIAIDLSSTRRGGPYISSKAVIDSLLKYDYNFKEIIYDISIGRGISWKRIKNLKKQIKEADPICIIITGLQLSCFQVCIAAMLAGVKKRIITIHGSSTEALNISWVKKWLLYIVEYLSLAMCTSFYGVSQYASNLSASKWFKNKNRGYVYNLYSSKITLSQLQRSDLGLNDNDIVIATSGRITKEKGFPILTEAIKQNTNSTVKFLIIGDGAYLEEMRLELSEKEKSKDVIFTGFTEDVAQYLTISDIFVLPTLHETLSISLLEAGYAGLPLISCKVGGVPEVIMDGVNGILVAPNNVKDLCNAISQLVDNPAKRKEMGAEARKRIETIFSNDNSLKKLRQIIESEISN